MTKRILSAFLFVAIIISSTSCRKDPVESVSEYVNSSANNNVSSDITSADSVNEASSSTLVSSKQSPGPKENTSSSIPEKTAFQYFDEADKKMDALNTYEYEMKEIGIYNVNGKKYTGTVIDHVKVDINKKIFTVEETLITEQGTQKKYAFYTNGKYYVKDDVEYLEKSFNDYYSTFPDIWGEISYPDDPDITGSDILSSKIDKSGGVKTVSLVVNSSKFIKQFKEFYEQLGKTVISAKMENIEIEAIINSNGHFDKLITHQVTQMSFIDTEWSMDITYELTLINPGTNITIMLPKIAPNRV